MVRDPGEVFVAMPQPAAVVHRRCGDDGVGRWNRQTALTQPRAQAGCLQPERLGELEPPQAEEILLEAVRDRWSRSALEDFNSDQPNRRDRPMPEFLLEHVLEPCRTTGMIVVDPDRAVDQNQGAFRRCHQV